MQRKPSKPEGLRTTLSADAGSAGALPAAAPSATASSACVDESLAVSESPLENRLTAPRIKWLAVAFAVFVGIGFGSRIGSTASAPMTATGEPGSLGMQTSKPAPLVAALDEVSDSVGAADALAAVGSVVSPNEGFGEYELSSVAATPAMSSLPGIAAADLLEVDLDRDLTNPLALARTGRFDKNRFVVIDSLPAFASALETSLASLTNSSSTDSALNHPAMDFSVDMDPAQSNLHDPLRSLVIVTRGEIAPGESLGAALSRQGVSAAAVHVIATEMRQVFDFRHSRPGDRYRLGQNSDGKVLDLRYSQNPEESYYLAWEGTRYTVHKETSELRPQVARIAGIVESSFYNAIVGLGEQSALASEFARILAWDIDFSRNVQPGDEFSILYERLYRQNSNGGETYVRPGRVLAGRYKGGVGKFTVVYYEDEENGGAYFRPDGTSIERAFLAAPLEFSRISSRFTRARAHPILKVTRPHPGIDYAAPHGTPIYSVADGVIEYRARAGASGNLIRVRHRDGYTSHYAHLSRFAKSLNVGDRVEQKQIIGYVGSSGLSTGPHVCFRVKKDGNYVDPMKISSPAGESVDGERLPDFLVIRDQLLANLGPGPVTLAADEAL